MGFLPFFSLETWILLITFCCIFVMYGHWTYGVFEKLGIPGPKPKMYFGTVGRMNPVFYIEDSLLAQKYGKVWGMYELRKPVLAVMDPDVLKIVLIKECLTHFTNRRNLRLNGDLSDAVSIAEDDQWRKIRSVLSPYFSSGRMKEMFNIMKHHSHKLTVKLQSSLANNDVINVKEFFGPYSMDIMISIGFGGDMDFINNPSCPLLTLVSAIINIYLFSVSGCFPVVLPLLELLGVSFFSRTTTGHFKKIVEKFRAERKGSSHQVWNITIIIFLMLNRDSSITVNGPRGEKQNQGLSDSEIVSQLTMFAMAGYETSAITLTFLAYNLARNPEITKRLQEEIDTTFPSKGPVQYEALMQMEYLDAVIKESLRLSPPIPRLERQAKETVKINDLTIPKDMIVMIPVYALHRDPELWPEPEEFKPERFSKENKDSINPYTYLPFGMGPRNCLGMRFALLLVKLALVEVLQKFSFSVCKETMIPLKMDASGILGPLHPIKLKLEPRSTDSEHVDK
uniref:unspecific monooxygenase n=1 Tax=Echeneis naucrates TaxID=173247 RepID=A0A665U0Y3_ECHNA